MASIYDIDLYNTNKNDYVENEIVKCGACLNDDASTATGRFYYNLENTSTGNTNGLRPSVTGGEAFWGGYVYVSKLGEDKPHFFWKPSYGLNVSSTPRVLQVQFGDGYAQRVTDGIDINLINISMSFNQRDEKEAAAILHFLDVRKGTEPFYFKPPSPYGVMKKFICSEWQMDNPFHNNFNVSTTFKETS